MLSRVNSFKRDWSGSSAPSASSAKRTGSHEAPIDLGSDDGGIDGDGSQSWPPSPEPKSAPSRLPSKASAFSTSSSQPPSSASDPTLSPKTRRRMAMGLTLDPYNGVSSSSGPQPTFSTANGLKRPAPNDFQVEDHLVSSKKKLATGPVQASDSNLQKGKSKKKKKGKIELSEEQKKVLDMVVKDGKNVFFTGSAGTGKSVLLREIIQALRIKYANRRDAVAVTASTGIAACNVGGTTLHSFAGIGLGIDPADKLAAKVRKSQKHLGRWTRTKVLIIDEVSMVDGDLFDKLAKIGTIIRRDQKPFGGIQLIVTGDFFQLPPVSKGDVKFAFEARMWKEAIASSVNLTQVFRQKDPTFVDMLTQMRFGQLDDHSTKKFKELSRPVDYADGIMPTELYPRREDVDAANSQRLAQLHTESLTFVAKDRGNGQPMDQLEKELNNMLAVKKLTLKVDAQAMLIKNLDDDLVNGSIGIVIGFFSETESALRSRESEWEDGADSDGVPSATPAAKRKAAEGAAGGANVQRWPLIRFSLPGGGYREQLIMPEEFKIDEADGTVKASREQLPLILSWAMSIHKSQGQTLERVKVDLRRIFEKGQAYVALSRATSLEQLQVLNFEPKKVMCHAKVVKFTHTLEVIR